MCSLPKSILKLFLELSSSKYYRHYFSSQIKFDSLPIHNEVISRYVTTGIFLIYYIPVKRKTDIQPNLVQPQKVAISRLKYEHHIFKANQ